MEYKKLILTATEKTQGDRASDYCGYESIDGEFVVPCAPCMSKIECMDIDSECGCRRMMIGIESCAGTTTARVVETNKTEKEIKEEFMEFYEEHSFDGEKTLEEIEKLFEELYAQNIKLAQEFGLGTIVEKRGEKYMERR